MMTTREKKFMSWWKKHHHNRKAHHWLQKNARRVGSCFYLPGDQWEDILVICKRYNLSEYKRLTEDEAYTLWRACYPTDDERLKTIILTARVLDEKIQELKKLQGKQSSDKPLRLCS